MITKPQYQKIIKQCQTQHLRRYEDNYRLPVPKSIGAKSFRIALAKSLRHNRKIKGNKAYKFQKKAKK